MQTENEITTADRRQPPGPTPQQQINALAEQVRSLTTERDAASVKLVEAQAESARLEALVTRTEAALEAQRIENGDLIRKLAARDAGDIAELGVGIRNVALEQAQAACEQLITGLGGSIDDSHPGAAMANGAIRDCIEAICALKGVSAPAEVQGAATDRKLYVECRQCSCGHVGINDASTTLSTCSNCDWSGPSPVEDHCPGCADSGCMGCACPKCGDRYDVLAEARLAAHAAGVQVAPNLPPEPPENLAARLEGYATSERSYTWAEYSQAMKEASDALHAITLWRRANPTAGVRVAPDGFKWVPLEPTERMIQTAIAFDVFDAVRSAAGLVAKAIYKEMLAAAPALSAPTPSSTAVECRVSVVHSDGTQTDLAGGALGSPPEPAVRDSATDDDITCDQCIELEGELHREYARQAIAATRTAASLLNEGEFRGGMETACDEFEARLNLEVESTAPEARAIESEKLIQRQNTQAMADCMDMVRTDLIEMGIIDKTVAPMFIPEAVANCIQKLREVEAPSAGDDPEFKRLLARAHGTYSEMMKSNNFGHRVDAVNKEAALIAHIDSLLLAARKTAITKTQQHLVEVVRSFGDVSCAAYISTWHKPEAIEQAITGQSGKDGAA